MGTILIRGYYGVNNLGDDVILNSVVNTVFKSGHKNIKVAGWGDSVLDSICISNSDHVKLSQTEIPHNIIKRYAFFAGIDYFIYGGGGLFPYENPSGLRDIYNQLRVARNLKTKIVFYGIEINPIKQEETKRLWKQMIDLADFAILRNKQTYDLLCDCGCDLSKLIHSSDVTFAYPDNNKACRTNSEKVMLWAPNCLFTAEEMKRKDIQQRYALICRQIAETCDSYPEYRHIFLPFHPQFDIPYIKDITAQIKKSVYEIYDIVGKSPLQLRALFNTADFCMCFRFHSVVFSLFYGKPFFAISYSPKTTELLNEVGLADCYEEYGIRTQDFFGKIFDLNEDVFRKKLQNVIENQEDIRERIAGISARLKCMAKTNESVLLRWLKE